MSELDILLTLYSIVAGLGISKLAQGVSVMIQARQRLQFYWVHSLWMMLIMASHVVTIFALIRFTHSPHWTVFNAMLTLTVPLLLYLLSDLVVPDINDDEERVDLKEYFCRNRKWLMSLLIGVILCGAASQLAVAHAHQVREIGPSRREGGVQAERRAQFRLGLHVPAALRVERSEIHAVLRPVRVEELARDVLVGRPGIGRSAGRPQCFDGQRGERARSTHAHRAHPVRQQRHDGEALLWRSRVVHADGRVPH